MPESLDLILKGIEWGKNVDNFVNSQDDVVKFQGGCHLISVWAHELGVQYFDSPARPFLQEMKASLFYVPACISLGLYKPAASSMRSALENALYFSYFHSHLVELETLVHRDSFYITKNKIIAYHQEHTRDFTRKQDATKFVAELDHWYSEVSAIIHGQIPGVWSTYSLKATAFSQKMLQASLEEFEKAVKLISLFFLLTVEDDIWDGFGVNSRTMMLKGLSPEKRAVLARTLT